MELYNSSNIAEPLAECVNALNDKVEGFVSTGSGWSVDGIVSGSVHTATFDPIGGSGFLKTPAKLISKMALTNIKNKDDRCLFYCMLAEKYKNVVDKRQTSRPKQYDPYFKELNMQGIRLPVQLRQLEKIEKQNPEFSLNVLYYDEEEEKCFPLHVSRLTDRPIPVNMLLLTGVDEGGNSIGHYVLISDQSRLVYERSGHHGKAHVCLRCLNRFYDEKGLKEHGVLCGKKK